MQHQITQAYIIWLKENILALQKLERSCFFVLSFIKGDEGLLFLRNQNLHYSDKIYLLRFKISNKKQKRLASYRQSTKRRPSRRF